MELECLVSGKPKPIILWSRADKEAPMPDGSMQMESYDGVLRIVNVSREMTGSYRCQTSQYNGFNVKPREAVVELIVQCEWTVCFFSLLMSVSVCICMLQPFNLYDMICMYLCMQCSSSLCVLFQCD